MGTKFNHCPNCKITPGNGFFSGGFKVFECKKCGTNYCYECGKGRCPNCASKEQFESGYVYKK